MIEIDFNAELRNVEEKLGSLKDKAPDVLRNALNTTARKVRKQIVKDAKGEYQLSDKSLLQATKAMKMTNARKGTLMAVLKSQGGVNDLMKFMVSPTTLARGELAPDSYIAQVLKGTGAKSLDYDPKPFITQFRSGHIAVVERVPGRKMVSNPEKDFIKKLLSPSVPHMLKNPEVQEKASEIMESELPRQIEKQIEKYLQKGR